MDRYKRKVLLIGDGAVGKTSLVGRFVRSTFSERYQKTLNVVVEVKEIPLEDCSVVLQIFDIFGQKSKYNKNLHASHYMGASGYVLVVDGTRPETCENLCEKWTNDLFEVTGEIPGILAINKSDLLDDKTLDDFSDVGKELGIEWDFMTSAKTGENVEEMFKALSEVVMNYARNKS